MGVGAAGAGTAVSRAGTAVSRAVPAGLVDGLPVGMQVLGRHHRDLGQHVEGAQTDVAQVSQRRGHHIQ